MSQAGDIWSTDRRSRQQWSKRPRRTPDQLHALRFARSQSRLSRQSSGRGDSRGSASGGGGHWQDRRRKAAGNRHLNYARQRQWNRQQYDRGRERERDRREEKSNRAESPPVSSSDARAQMLNNLVLSLPDAPLAPPTNIDVQHPLSGLLSFAAGVTTTQNNLITLLSRHTTVPPEPRSE